VRDPSAGWGYDALSSKGGKGKGGGKGGKNSPAQEGGRKSGPITNDEKVRESVSSSALT